MIAREFTRWTQGRGRSLRIAFALSEPYIPPRYDDEPVERINFVVVAATYNPHGNSLTSVFPGHRNGSIVEMVELAELRGTIGERAQREVLFALGVTEIHWADGNVTINPSTGRWGEGGPGSDDYMSFGI